MISKETLVGSHSKTDPRDRDLPQIDANIRKLLAQCPGNMISRTRVASFCSPDGTQRNLFLRMEEYNLGRICGECDDFRFQKKHFSVNGDFAQHLIVNQHRLPLWIFGCTKGLSQACVPNPAEIFETRCVHNMRTENDTRKSSCTDLAQVADTKTCGPKETKKSDVTCTSSPPLAATIETCEIVEKPLLDRISFRDHCAQWIQQANVKTYVEQTRYAVDKWVRVLQCRESARYPVKCNLTYHIRAAELPPNSFVFLRRGHHDHDDAGVVSGRIWTPQQHAAARRYVHSDSKPTVMGLRATLSKDQGRVSPNTPTANRLVEANRKGKKQNRCPRLCACRDNKAHDRRTCQGAYCEYEPFELCASPPNVIIGDTARNIFANYAMLHGTLHRYEDKFVYLAVDGKYKVNDRG